VELLIITVMMMMMMMMFQHSGKRKAADRIKEKEMKSA
jgi:hypothetical protein